MNTPAAPPASSRLRWAGFWLGFALGGFFDGILLHQLLQWHHVLSNVAALQDLRAQVVADGLFHALMYLIAACALVLLWKGRADLPRPGADRVLWGAALVGFGVWHILDNVVFHWIAGLHRIRLDSPNPLFWDLLWFVVFGLVPIALGWLYRRRGGGGGGGRTAAASLALAAVVAGPIALWPPQDSGGQVLVLFRPGMTGAQAFNALSRVGARVLWADRSGGLWAIALPDAAAARNLYGEGALLVSNSALAAGCLGWSRPVAGPGAGTAL